MAEQKSNPVLKARLREKRRDRMRENSKRRRRDNPKLRMVYNARIRACNARKRGFKSGSAVRDRGCPTPFFNLFIEHQFWPGMTWANYGKWQIDHVRSLASFDLTDRGQFLEAFHYTNCQPLWADDNRAKQDDDLTFVRKVKNVRHW
jgi:hypothetical protein